ncbi:carcinoembryonic antigen-related cell adhesion molecule 1 [Lampris incognitus]|uniref:carcinoembryonic antigen-related cell adhesion molecule 1 n=1 Tax=Lampris incognitus TaxID=2546036 RepID=UPI0024B5074D|nr:carcinoembryonic antigen-related cell adhesion molecule 1 [Lampris incognitus]
MVASLVSVLTLALLISATDFVCGQEIHASKDPLPVGSNVTLSVSNHTTITVGLWQKNGNTIVLIYPGGFKISDEWKDRATFNPNSSALTIRSLQLADSGLYALQSLEPVFRSQITLSVQEPISNVSLRANATSLVESNDTAVLTCSVAQGSSLSYQWLNGSSEVTAGGAILISDGGRTLTIVNVTRYDKGPFKCNVSNDISADVSQPVYLNISYGPVDPTVMVSPMKAAYKTGSDITLNCSAESSPPAKVSWLFDGQYLNQFGSPLQLERVKENQTGSYKCLLYNDVTNKFSSVSAVIRIVEPISEVVVNVIGGLPIQDKSFTLSCNATGPVDYIRWWMNGQIISANNVTVLDNTTLTLNGIQQSDSGDYQCEAFNAVSNKTSSRYKVLVNYGPEKPTVTGPDQVIAGHRATFNCSASSYPPSVYSWFFDGFLLANTPEYVTRPLYSNMSGKYICMAYNNITGRNSSAYKMLTVVEPIVNVQVEVALKPAIDGHSYMLHCNVTGTADYVYWMKDGGLLHVNKRIALSWDNKTVTFNPVENTDSGDYQCMAVNIASNMTSHSYNLLVNFGPEGAHVFGPSVAETGTHANFSCVAPSVPPSYISWFFNETIVANTSMFITDALALNMSGVYTCMAYNNVTQKNSTNTTTLTVIEAIESVMVKPNSIPIDSKNLTLACEVTGPYHSVYWMKNNTKLDLNCSTPDSNMWHNFGSNLLHFSPVTVHDNGNYQCVATNLVGPHKSPEYKLLVNYGPVTMSIVGPHSVALGSAVTVSLNCSADSQPTSNYQWFFNYKPSVIENGPVVTIKVSKQNMGNYTCEATNPLTKHTMTQTSALIITGYASALPVQTRGGLMLIALLALFFPVVSSCSLY